MALVSCPECERENVSDTAVSCPDCGFAIKEYFDKIKLEEERVKKEKEQQARKEAEERHRQETAGERQKETITELEQQIKDSSKEIKGGAIGLLISLPLTILFFSISSHGSLGFFIVMSALAAFISLGYLISGISQKNTAKNDLEIAKRSIIEYENNISERIQEAIKQNQAYVEKQALKHPTCPLCGSNNTERISTLSKAISVGTIGLASSKIGKQYQCKNCKHKW